MWPLPDPYAVVVEDVSPYITCNAYLKEALGGQEGVFSSHGGHSCLHSAGLVVGMNIV